MAEPIKLKISHQLGRAEARRRIEAGFSKAIGHLPGGGGQSTEHWEGDRLDFTAATMGQTIAGFVDVGDTEVAIQVTLPGLLGLLAGGISGQLSKVGQRLLSKR